MGDCHPSFQHKELTTDTDRLLAKAEFAMRSTARQEWMRRPRVSLVAPIQYSRCPEFGCRLF
jgi:hypothetical protein